MSSSGAEYTEQQKSDRSAVTTALTDPKNAQVMQEQGDKLAANKAAVADRAHKAAEAAKAAKEGESKRGGLY